MSLPSTTDAQGRHVFIRSVGSGFLLVAEARLGTGRFRVGDVTFNSDLHDPTARPDVQILVSRPLGNGSTDVCDKGPPPVDAPIGGVPGVAALDFGPSQQVANALNDLGCRFDSRTDTHDACTLGPVSLPAFVVSTTTTQFCSVPVVGREIAFPNGDTVVSVQVRDIHDNIGDRRSLVVRVQ